MRRGKSYRSLYLPAWTIVAAVVVLLGVIAFSTYRNLSRETGRMEAALLREGLVIIRAIEAGVRANPAAIPPEAAYLQKLVTEIARDPEVAAIVLFDDGGTLLAASPPRPSGERIAEADALRLLLTEKGMVTRYRGGPGPPDAFEILLPFRPFAHSATPRPELAAAAESPTEAPLRRWAADKRIGLSLRLAAFERARREDRHHTLLMAGIVLALGAGALFFLFIVQNYYRVDRSLRRMEGYTENVVESMADGLISLDREGRIVTLNRQAARIAGDTGDALVGRGIGEVLGAEIAGLLAAARDGRFLRDREASLLCPSGERIPLSLSAAPLTDEAGRELGSVLLLRDLRELRALQERVSRSERLAALGRLAAGMAHEIRNPLSSIRGFAQFFLKRFGDRAEEREYAAIMVKEVDRLNRVITDLLDFARPQEPHRESLALAPIADQALGILAPDLAARKVAVVRDFAPGLPPLPVDRDQLLRLFINLLLNALEAMEAGGTLRIGLSRSAAPAGVEIALSDTGTGIDPEDREKIFEPFFSRKRKGTGLGLAIVHQIVEGHGGTIGVESEPGRGTTFRIRLPLGEGTEDAGTV